MADSQFIHDLNFGNDDFQKACEEEFEVLTHGRQGTCKAVNIDDLSAGTSIVQGGFRADNTVVIFIKREEFEAAQIREDSKLRVRGNKVRIISITDEGDNTLTITCASAGTKFST